MPQPKKPMTAAKPAAKAPVAKAPAKSPIDSAEMKFKADSVQLNKTLLDMGKDLKRQLQSKDYDSIDSARTAVRSMQKEVDKMQTKYPGRKVF